jgi:hypothetical protein
VLTNSVNQFQVQYWVTVFLCSRRKTFPLKAIINAEASEDVDNMDSNGKDTFSLAPRSQEGNFLSHDEICSPVSSRRTQPSCALGGPLHLLMVDHPFKERMNIHQRLDIGKRSNIVYTIRRELSEVPTCMSSPPRKVIAPSDFKSCSGLVKNKPKG